MSFAINSQRIAKNTLAMYLRLGITMIISFYTARVTLQQLGVEDYGLNNLVGSIVSMFSFINGSMGTAVQRFYSLEIGKNNFGRLRRVFGVGLYLHILVAVFTLLVAEVFAVFFLHKMNIPGDRMFAAQVVYQISVFSLVLNIINVPYAALLRAREMFSQTAMVEIIQSFLRLVVIYLLVHINFDKLITFSFLNLGITLFYVGALFFMARRFKETHQRPIHDKELIGKMLSFISMLLVTVLAQLLNTKGIVILINLFFGLVINAAYAVAVQVSNMVNSFVQSFKQSMVPQMMSAYGAGDNSAMCRIINMGTKVTFILMMLITIPVVFEGQFLLNIWLGTPPEHSAKLMTLVLVAINVRSFTYFQYQGVHATGQIMAQQVLMSSLYIINIIIIYCVFKLGGHFESALYVDMIVGAIQCAINLFYANKTFLYNIRYFFFKILLPCMGLVFMVISVVTPIALFFEPSVWRFLLVFGVSEFLICGLGYFVVLDGIERMRIKTLIEHYLASKKHNT